MEGVPKCGENLEVFLLHVRLIMLIKKQMEVHIVVPNLQTRLIMF
jgi:hypothetical protein